MESLPLVGILHAFLATIQQRVTQRREPVELAHAILCLFHNACGIMGRVAPPRGWFSILHFSLFSGDPLPKL
jgi:hypothetical protein